eukprot:g7992.t1
MALALCCCCGTAQRRQFNILFIGTDQQRTSTLRSYGNEWAHSPNIDRLADEGVRFSDAYTVSPVCSPSRTAVLLGVHVPIHGVYENGVVQHDHVASLTPYFDVLKAQNYSTALIGKTHFNPVPASIDHLDAHTGNSDKRGANVSADDFLETYLVNQTMAFIDSVRAANGTERKWFVYCSMVSPHPPNWVPEGPWAHVYDGVALPPLNYRAGDIAALPYQTRMLLGLLGREHDDPPAFPLGRANMSLIDAPAATGVADPDGRYNYYAQAAYVDAQVGRLLDFLDARALANDTLVVFASDHGTELYDHGINNDKHNFLDASLRVPLLMRLPGQLPAGATRRFATTLDITATIVAAAGADTPRDYQGFDLLTPLAAGLPSPRAVGVSCEYRAMAVVTPSWKLAYFPEQGEGRMYDRVRDPLEQTDLFANTSALGPAAAAATARARDGLLIALLRWRAQQDAIGYLQLNSKAGAATATLAWNHTESVRGTDAELRLQEDALRWERGS